MIRSMTGFGMGEVRVKDASIVVEIKTVNHKFFEMTGKIPNSIAGFEERIKQIVQKKIRRGKANLNVITNGALSQEEMVRLNLPMARGYLQELKKLKRSLSLTGDVTVDDLILFPGVLQYETNGANLTKLWPKLKQALDRAVDRLVTDREKEGKALCRDLDSRIRKIRRMLGDIHRRSELHLEEYKERFAERIRSLTGTHQIDPGRLEMEAAIFAKSCDISEEITRLQNHIVNFKKTISGNGEVGKKLDFIAQELHREANTIGAKASDFTISKNVINIKSEIEKIREQVKNIE